MKLPVEVKQVILKYAAKYPLPAGETACQSWTHNLCQQLKYSFPTAGWGHKSASSGRPHSKDAVALESPFIGWDVINGAGTPSPVLSLDGDSIDLTGQLFEPVEAKNYLEEAPPVEPPVDPPVEPPASGVQEEILAELKKQTFILTAIAKDMAAIPAQVSGLFKDGVKIRF